METQILAPNPGKDYPQTWNEFLDWFATEEACLA
ncbi:MAG: IS1595 family transposase, partial [Burkholderiales bacterium]|nr:IS1595 family transposase [Burkholderiales bacterium]MBI2748862.1 IS1595 family transposase [Burkholderiales bacterium]